jgi:hypothetical protein
MEPLMGQIAHTARNLSVTRRQSFRRLFAVAMLLLGVAVVCWGLHDKLSLYTPPGVASPSAKAKLLSEQERATPALVIAAPQTPTVFSILSVTFFLGLQLFLLRKISRLAMVTAKAQAPLFRITQMRRPPPTSICTA